MVGPIVVVGSINMDLVFRVPRFPRAGETLPGTDFRRFPGGKGANQAVGLARLGGDVRLIGALGRDPYGKELKASLQEEGVDVSRIIETGETTGLAAITLSEDGENSIITIAGANHQVTPEAVLEARELFREAWGVLLQLEIPLKTVQTAARLGKENGCKVFLDPAPVTELPDSIYKNIDYLLPNSGELEALLPAEKDNKARAEKLLGWGVKNLILKKGEEGSSIFSGEGRVDYPAFAVKVVDTTAAGDAFAAALCYSLQTGYPIEKAIIFANAAGGVAATRLGARSSLPFREDILKLQKEAKVDEVDY